MAAAGAISTSAIPATNRESRRATFAILMVLLGIEPVTRALIWWWGGASVQGVLSANTRLAVLAMIVAAGNVLLAEVRAQVRRHRWLASAALVWSICAVVSSMNALDPTLAAVHSAWWAIYLLFGLSLLGLVREQPEVGPQIFLAWCIGFCAYALVILAFIVADPVRTSMAWTWQLPGVANVRHLGFEAMAAALIGSLFRPEARSARWTWLLRATAVLGWAVVFWSGGRGHVVAASVALLSLFLLCAKRGWGRRLIECLVLAVVGFALATLHQAPSGSHGAWRTIGLTQDSALSGGGDPTSGRMDMWAETLALIADNPVFGVGEAQAKLRLKTAGGVFAQPHNLVLQAGMAWGVLGGGAFLLGIAFAVYHAGSRLNGMSMTAPAAVGLAVALAMLANSMLDASMFHPRPIIMFMIGACLALGSSTSGATLQMRSAVRAE